MSKKGFGLIEVLIILAVLAIVGAAVWYGLYGKKLNEDSQKTSGQTAQASITPNGEAKQQATGTPDPFKTTNDSKTSPDGTYVVTETTTVGIVQLGIKKSDGAIISSDILPYADKQTLWKKFNVNGQDNIGFVGWNSNSKFVIKYVIADGREYLFNVDAINGKIDTDNYSKSK
jgi:hypothetical protein